MSERDCDLLERERWDGTGKADCVDRFPVYLNGYLIGGVGVNGGSVPQDEDVANVSVAALKARTSVP